MIKAIDLSKFDDCRTREDITSRAKELFGPNEYKSVVEIVIALGSKFKNLKKEEKTNSLERRLVETEEQIRNLKHTLGKALPYVEHAYVEGPFPDEQKNKEIEAEIRGIVDGDTQKEKEPIKRNPFDGMYMKLACEEGKKITYCPQAASKVQKAKEGGVV